MKGLIIVGVFVTFMFSIAGAATIEVGSSGDIRILTAPMVWEHTTVVVDDSVLFYGDTWKKAYATPGIVPIKTHDTIVQDGFFHEKTITIADIGVMREGDRIHLVHNAVIKSKNEFFPYKIFFMLAALSLFVGLFLLIMDKSDVAGPFIVVSLFSFFVFCSVFASCLSAVFFFVVAAVVVVKEKEFPIFSFGMGCLCVVAGIMSFLWS